MSSRLEKRLACAAVCTVVFALLASVFVLQARGADQASQPPVTGGAFVILENNSDGANKCLIFGANGTEKFPSRYNWGHGSDFCGFPGGRDALLANKQAVFQLVQLDATHYALTNDSDGSNKCLIFGDNGKAKFPSRYNWGHGSDFCGFPGGRDALLANKQAVFQFIPLDATHYTLTNDSDGSNKCLIFGDNGKEKLVRQ